MNETQKTNHCILVNVNSNSVYRTCNMCVCEKFLGGIMVKLKGRNHYISEKIVKKVFKHNDKFYLVDNYGNRYEIEELDYYNLGGK